MSAQDVLYPLRLAFLHSRRSSVPVVGKAPAVSSRVEPLEPRRLMTVTADISGPSTVDEGSVYTATLSAYLSGSESYSIHTLDGWSVDWGDGSSSDWYTGSYIQANHIYADGDDSHTITATAYASYLGTDSYGTESSTDTQYVTVQNVAPAFSLTGADITVVGETYTLTRSGVTDPGVDTITQWVVDWGNGQTSTYGPLVTQFEHPYKKEDEGVKNITVKAVDEDGTFGRTKTVDVKVPTVTITALDADKKANEDGTKGKVTIKRSGAPIDKPLKVDLDWSTAGAENPATRTGPARDYEDVPDSIEIPADKDSIDIIITPRDDPEAEGVEAIPVSVKNSDRYKSNPGQVVIVNLDDNVSVQHIDVSAAPGGDNQVYGYSFTVRIDVTGEHLDKVEIRQLITTSTSLQDFNGHQLTDQEIQAAYPNTPANILNSGGQYVVDTNWDWQGLAVVANTKNGKAHHEDNQRFDVTNRQADRGNGVMTTIAWLAETSNYFKIETREKNTNRQLLSSNWGYRWDNYFAYWSPGMTPPPPANTTCAAEFIGNGVFSSIEGITGLDSLN